MNLRQMEVFRAIMLTGSIAGAAELLHISQSAVSKMLSHTQQRMGLKLFELVKGRLVATREAIALYEEIERLWRNVEKVHSLAGELANPNKGSLYIAASPSLGMTVVPQSVAATVKERPELRVKVILPLPSGLIEVVADKLVDIGISNFSVDHPSITVHARYHYPLVCIMAPDHPLARQETIRPADLVGHRMISVPLQELYGISEEKVYGEVIEQLNIGVEVRSGLIASLFSLASGEVAVVDALTISNNLLPQLEVRPLETRERIQAEVIHNSYRPLSPQAERFRDILCDKLAALQAVPF
ncbi:LysR family transcriptional regulator [Stutzerimonas kirkiae]|nr:LysR substrate-binding domain-containing protein [Stutzerimonas kirkiae]